MFRGSPLIHGLLLTLSLVTPFDTKCSVFADVFVFKNSGQETVSTVILYNVVEAFWKFLQQYYGVLQMFLL